MSTSVFRRLLIVAAVLGLAACARARPPEPVVTPPVPAPPEKPAPEVRAPEPPPIPEALKNPFESRDFIESPDFIITLAKAEDTAESLAARYLHDASKAWMIEEYAGARTFPEGQVVVIPKHDWNPIGVYPGGYQLVPVLVFHNITREQKGRLSISSHKFEEQMRYLQAEGFRTVSLRDFLDFNAGHRQLPRKSVLLTFDDGWRSFGEYAHPLLKQLGFTATLSVYTAFIGAGREALSWNDLKDLIDAGFEVQAHGKTHSDLLRRSGESDAQYAKRMQAELGQPLALFRKHLGHESATLAYPYGHTNEELLQQVVQYGYTAAFTVRRQSNPAFVFPFQMSRSQIYGDMTLQEFAKNLNIFQDENLGLSADLNEAPRQSAEATAPPSAESTPAPGAPVTRQRLADVHNEWSESLEHRGRLGQALDERVIALIINPDDTAAQAAQARLAAEVKRQVADLTEEARGLLARGLHGEAQKHFLRALALDPRDRTAFETVQNQVQEVTFIVHTVRPKDTLASLADLYYGDRARAEVIAETNHLPPNAHLTAGQRLQIPEIPGVPFLSH